MKTLAPKKPAKDKREKLILFGVVELYLQTGKPVGSNTLMENGFESLSSATIRNYFGKLEEEGLLKQQHSSGGRIPTSLAYKLYAEEHLDKPLFTEGKKKAIREVLGKETREIVTYLQRAAEAISELTQCAVFLTAPRFDQDFILDIKLIGIDEQRLLCAIVTDFGMVHTEVFPLQKKLSNFAIKRIESYFNWRLTNLDKPTLEEEEEKLAAKLYKELMLRHIVSYTNFSSEDLFQAGFAKLLSYPDFNDAVALASGLSLFENKQGLRELLRSSCEKGALNCWIGEALAPFSPEAAGCSVLAIPYRINQTQCGAFGILGPTRLPYRQLFGMLQEVSEAISDCLTKSIYKFKLSFRQPKPSHLDFKKGHSPILEQSQCLLLENKPSRSH